MDVDKPTIYPYPGGKARSRVWTHFGFYKIKEGGPSKENLDMTKAICKICRRSYANKGNTTNLAVHLDMYHTELSATGTTVKQKLTGLKQAKLSFEVPKSTAGISSLKSTEIDDALLQLLCQKALPISLVDNAFFKKFVGLLNPRYQIPHRKLVKSKLQQKMNDVKQKMKSDLDTCQNVAITHDGWTSCNTESYSTITAHFIDTEWNLKAVSLETTKVEGQHTSENIAAHLKEAVAKWNLSIPIAVSDNAANERKAFELLGWTRLGCYGHRINLVVKHSLSVPAVQHMVAKGRKLVGFFHQSSSANDALIAKQQLLNEGSIADKLIMDVPTRWNSTYAMLSRILELSSAIYAVANDPTVQISKTGITTIRNYAFTFEEQLLAEKICAILEPFQKATVSVSSEETPTLQKIMPILLKLFQCIKITEFDPPAVKSVKRLMDAEMQKRTDDRDLGIMASVLNPFTKELAFLTEEERERGHKMLLEEALSVTCQVTVKTEKVSDEETLPPVPPLPDLPVEEVEEPNVLMLEPKQKARKCGEDDWFNDVIVLKTEQIPQNTMIREEISRYLGCVVNQNELSILDWWRENSHFYPRVACIARKYLSVPASSVPSERIFSLCGSIISKKRSRMNPDNLDMLVFLNRNMKYYW
ncbi:E3 SUMO-protein ligase ZBED1-like [Argopecten irradians]|uniref:E3 SUMO-protein ligase ZBED1-like n=1 Tax=Argopecten irradians TaxID=31199 RepID=UPI00371CF127